MRLGDAVTRCVVFVGWAALDGVFTAAGTAFFVAYKGSRYLVTNRHIASDLGDDPFAIRFNKDNGEDSDNITVDPIPNNFRWHVPADEIVDLAITSFNFDLRAKGYDALCIPEDGILRRGGFVTEHIGIGDFAYAVGVFKLIPGARRNLPVVHTGHIALLPGGEKIPVKRPDLAATQMVDGYLVQTTNLDGLSGSPVFARPTIDWPDVPTPGGQVRVLLPENKMLLMGIWQASFKEIPSMGVVVPSHYLLSLLESDDVRRERNAFLECEARENGHS